MVLGDEKKGEVKNEVIKNSLAEGLIAQGTDYVGGDVLAGDVYKRPDGSFETDLEGRKKMYQKMYNRLEQSDVKGLYERLYPYIDYQIILRVLPEKLPIFSAMRAAQINNPELEKWKAEDIILSQELQKIKFPCGYAEQASVIAWNVTGKRITFTSADECK